MERAPDIASDAYVSVRVISTATAPEGFDSAVTRAANTQNHVQPRDFVALDPVQSQIQEDFLLSLQKTYAVKRGELDPPEDEGCSVVHAALALACAQRNPEPVARANNDINLLWERGSKGAYRLLFDPAPNAYHIWRSVLLLREVSAALRSSRNEREGRAAAIAEEGDLLIAHIVFQRLADVRIGDPEFHWEDAILPSARQMTSVVLAWLIHHVDSAFGPTCFISSTFTNPDRCQLLVDRVLAGLEAGVPVPEMPSNYKPSTSPRRPRRRNAVPTLVDAGRISDGTALVFQPAREGERVALEDWLTEEPKRARATWINERGRPLLWAADGERYSPTGLVMRIWDLAGWKDAPVAVQGPAQWVIIGEGSLASLADEVRRRNEESESG
jgi:hypothetical protein